MISRGLVVFMGVLTLALSACAPAASPASTGGSSGPLVALGDSAALEGSWVENSTEAALGGGTVTATLTYTFASGSFSASQVNHFSDGRPDETYSQTGTAVLQASDATVTIHETSEIYKGTGPNTIDKTMVLRNVLVDNVWHPCVYLRVGTGQGLGGVWESPKNGTSKLRITFTTGAGTFVSEQYALDGTGAVTGSPVGTQTGSFSWDGSVMTTVPGSGPSPCKLLSNQLLEMPLLSSTRVPVFHKL